MFRFTNFANFVFLVVAVSWCSLASAQSSDKAGEAAEKVMAKQEVIFDGSSLDNFRGYKKDEIGAGWKIDDGALMFDGSGGGDIMTKKMYENFELTFHWKVDSLSLIHI